MEQANNVAMSMLKSMAGKAVLPGAGKGDGSGKGFRRMLEKIELPKETLPDEPPRAEITPVRPKMEKASAPKQTEKDSVQQQEDPIETSMKAQMVVVGQVPPEQVMDPITLKNPETGEDLVIAMGDWAPQVWAYEATPEEIAGSPYGILEEQPQVADVSDPEADAMLEATAPGADNSPAAMLEKVVNEQIGKAEEQTTEEAKPQGEDDNEIELIDVEQAPQRIFQDVKAAPVKVGEVENPAQVDEADVLKQVETQVAQTIEQGNSSVTVKLNPENLGEVTVQVSMKSGGALAVAISARNDDTRVLLERHASRLQEMLGSRVREGVEVDIQRQQESQQSQNQNQNQNYDGRNGHPHGGQQERRHQEHSSDSQSFMQQLRLGLIPMDEEDT